MEILTPQTVQREKQGVKAAANARVRDLANEESRLVRSVNSLRLEEEEALKRKRERDDEKDGRLQVQKTVLEAEVEALEARKAKALEPIARQEEVLRQRDAELSERERINDEASTKNAKDAEAIRRARLELNDRENLTTQREGEVARREGAVQGAEEEVKSSTEALAARWTEYHASVAAADERIQQKESDIAAREDILVITKEEQDKRAKELDERERGITVRYAFLEKAEETYKLNHPDHGN